MFNPIQDISKKVSLYNTAPAKLLEMENKENGEESDMISIFDACQENNMSHDRLCQQLKKIYNEISFAEFWEDFLELAKYTISSLNRSANYERTIDFIVKFVLFCCKVDVQGVDVDNSNDKQLALLIKLLKFCVKFHDSHEAAVRFRCVQIMRKLLDGMGDEATISDELFQTIQTRLLKRVWDVKVFIRVEATFGLARLQDPTDRNCPIVTTYLHIVKHDSHPDVRRAALKSVAVTTKTLSAVCDRCRDVHDLVRKQAFEILTARSILKPLSIAKRIRLLEDGLNDQSQLVRTSCRGLLKRWQDMLEGNVLDLLKRLDVEEAPDITEKALRTLLQDMSFEDMTAQIKDKLDEKRVLKSEFWNSEVAFYWRVVCNFLREKEDDAERFLEQLIPLGKDYSQLLSGLLKRQEALVTSGDAESLLELDCTIGQVMQMASFVDLSDEFGRQALIGFVKASLISNTLSTNTIGPIIKLLRRLESNETRLCDTIVELISEIRDPVEAEEGAPAPVVMDNAGEEGNAGAASTPAPPVPMGDGAVPVEIDRKMKIKLASLAVRLNELNEEMQEAITIRDFECAGQLRDEIVKLEVEKKAIIEQNRTARPTEVPVIPAAPQPMEGDADSDEENGNQAAQTQIRERNDPEILLKCNTMTVKAIENCKRLWKLPASLLSLVSSMTLSSITCPVPAVRKQAVLALGMCCTMSKELALKYIPLFYEILEMDHESIQVSALKCVIDWFLIFGLDCFQEREKKETSIAGSTRDAAEAEAVASDDDMFDSVPANKTANQTRLAGLIEDNDSDEGDTTLKAIDQTKLSTGLLAPLIKLLDSTSRELRTVCAIGLSKLIMQRKVSSPKLVSRLLLLWYNPVTEEDAELLNSLSIFFPIYASTRMEDQAALGDAVLPTLKTLFRAPVSSPLSEVDHWNVASLLLKLTDASQLFENRKNGNIREPPVVAENLDNPVHDDLAFRLVNEIMNAPNDSGVRLYVRMLANLRLSPTNVQVLKDLSVMLHPLEKKIKDRFIAKSITKFRDELKKRLSELGAALTPGRITATPCLGGASAAKVGQNSVQSRLSSFTKTMLENFDQPELLDEGVGVTEDRLASRLEETYLGHRIIKTADVTRLGGPIIKDDISTDDDFESTQEKSSRVSSARTSAVKRKIPGRQKGRARHSRPSYEEGEDIEEEADSTLQDTTLVEDRTTSSIVYTPAPTVVPYESDSSYQEVVINVTRMEDQEVEKLLLSKEVTPKPVAQSRVSRTGAGTKRTNVRKSTRRAAVAASESLREQNEREENSSTDEELASPPSRRVSTRSAQGTTITRRSNRSSLPDKIADISPSSTPTPGTRKSSASTTKKATNTRRVMSERKTRNTRPK